MDGFGGYKTAATEALPEAVTVMDPFHVVALAGHKLDLCRQRVQQDTLGHRGRSGDPLYGVRRALRTRDGLLTTRQWTRIAAVFADDAHAAVEATWCAYQQLIDAYAANDPQRGKTLLSTLIDLLRTGLPAGLEELAQLGRTLHRRRDDVLAYFTHRASNGPTEPLTAASKPYAATPSASAGCSTLNWIWIWPTFRDRAGPGVSPDGVTTSW